MRISAKELTALIMDEERVRAERADRKSWKSRVTGIEDYGGGQLGHGGADPRRREHRQRKDNDDDLELRLALEASKNEAEEERKRRERNGGANPADDDDLAKAIRLSKEEEELRRRELEETNTDLLFSKAPNTQAAAYQPTGNNQGYQQQGAVDWFGNLVDHPQQPAQSQNTGFLNNMYSQPAGTQPQATGFQNGSAGFPQQPQLMGFDQFGGQGLVQPQQTSFHVNNPYGQQYSGFGGDMGQQPQQQQQQQEQALQPGSHNPWSSTSRPQDSLMPQPTGSNNPFASAFGRPQPVQQRQPTLGTLQEQKTQTQFNNTSFNPPVSLSPAPAPLLPAASQLQPQPQPQPPKDANPHHAQLNALLASGEGQDTFGNTGNLRIPAQHTAPGTFVNSAGAGLNRLHANQTGSNPFLHSQFTGMPQQQHMVPAQTGPAGGFGANPYGASNPFGGRQQSAQQPGSGNLIDL